MPLIVVHADDGVEAVLANGLVEHRIRRMRSGSIESRPPRRLDGGRDDLAVLDADQSILAGVRVQTADRDSWRVAQARKGFVGESGDGEDAFRRHKADRVPNRHVGAHMTHGHFGCGQHHGEVPRAAEFGDELRVTDEAGGRDAGRLLVDGQGDHAGHFARQGGPCGRLDIVACRLAGLRVERSRGQIPCGQPGKVDDVQARWLRGGRSIDAVQGHAQIEEAGACLEDGRIAVDEDAVP